MANIKISLSSNRKINNVNIYSDVDVQSENIKKTIYDRNAIRNSISNILKWKPMERILNPNFGNSLWNNVFDIVARSSKNDIINSVRKMLSYEPRINVLDVNVSVSPDENKVDIDFTYTIPTLGDSAEKFSIVITRK